MTARCDLTDLLVDQCAHCLGHREPSPLDGIEIARTVTAVHSSRCALNARHGIEPGDLIGHTEHGWVCAGCTEGGRRR